MKSGYGATGNGDKQQRVPGAPGDRFEVDHGRDNHALGGKDADVDKTQGEDQLVRVDEVARLQQHPYRQGCGNKSVDHQQDDPRLFLGCGAAQRSKQRYQPRQELADVHRHFPAYEDHQVKGPQRQ